MRYRSSVGILVAPLIVWLEDVHAFQVHLVATGISWPALNQIVCALRFFYGVTLGQDTVPKRIARRSTSMRAELFRQALTTNHSIIELSAAGYLR